MQFSIVAILATVVVSVSAAPAPLFFRRQTCDIVTCIEDIGPSVAGCAGAVAQVGADPVSDGSCLLSAVKTLADFPDSCTGCLAKFGVNPSSVSAVTSPVASVVDGLEGDLEGAADKAKNAIEGLF
ncbi:CBP domain-containing protein [Mycena chlorophos]|uniref:CBP domain-containing protein n=1 Tax=Mycena chlorophos TaxID=658473 RepID=A0A8H6STN4_MYCCL|nr:CBP domain-containing protein [Mycena chlorophos]